METYQIATDDVLGMLKDVAFAAGGDKGARAYIAGVYLHTTKNTLRMAATDGHYLAVSERGIPENGKQLPGVLVPNNIVKVLPHVLRGSPVTTIEIDAKTLRFTGASNAVSAPIPDGSYPDYQRCVPDDLPYTLRVKSKDMSKALKALLPCVDRALKQPVVKVEIRHQELAVTTVSGSGRVTEEWIHPYHYNGPPMEIGLKIKYLSKLTSMIKGELAMGLYHNRSPVLIRETDNPNKFYALAQCRV